MSEAVSALGGQSWDEGIARIEEIGPQGMITLRGSLADPMVKNAATGVAAVDMPEDARANCVGDRGICWMSPDELLVLCPYDTVAPNLKKMRATLGLSHALAVDVSDARATFRLHGPKAREVLAKVMPVDLSPAAFTEGMFRRSRLAQVPAAIWLHGPETFQIVCFRSVAQYVYDVLKAAAAPGSAPDYF